MSYLVDNEICPSCDEKWEPEWGLKCANNCEHKQLEDKHRVVAKPMVNYCLPLIQGVKVDCPNNLTEEYITKIKDAWGWTTYYNKTITIPWLTLRSKEEFFDTVPHEAAHITSTELKFTSPSNRKIIAEYEELEEIEGEKHPLTIKYYRKNKALIKNWRSGIHGKDYWYKEYVRLHGELMKSKEYSIYNYDGLPPKKRKKRWEF